MTTSTDPGVRRRDRIANLVLVPDQGLDAEGFPIEVRLLSVPSKMPGFSFSLPAGPSCPFMVLGKGAICGEKAGEGHAHCYARRGHYIMRNIKNATWVRFNWIRECLKTAEGTERFISVMVGAIKQCCDLAGQHYFRIHDSGDFFSPAYTKAWAEIARRLPNVQFWAPTRSWQAPWLNVIVEAASLPNMTIRPSALYFEDAPPVIPGLAAGTSASAVSSTCPSQAQGHMCLDCRVCWNDKTTAVVYSKH